MKTRGLFSCARISVIVLALAGFCRNSRAQENPGSNSAIPTIQMTDAPLGQAVDLLARQSELNYILDPTVSFDRSSPLNFRWTNVTARTALARVLKEHDLDLVESPATTVARIAPHKLHVKPVDPALVGGDTNIVAHYPVGSDTNEALIPVIIMTDAPLDQAIKLLANEAHIKIIFDEGLSTWMDRHILQWPPVSFRWKKLTTRQALVALLDCYDLTLIEDPATHLTHIKAKPKTAAISTEF